MDVAAFHDGGLLRIEQIDPAEVSPGELVAMVREAVEGQGVRLVLIDSLTATTTRCPRSSTCCSRCTRS